MEGSKVETPTNPILDSRGGHYHKVKIKAISIHMRIVGCVCEKLFLIKLKGRINPYENEDKIGRFEGCRWDRLSCTYVQECNIRKCTKCPRRPSNFINNLQLNKLNCTR